MKHPRITLAVALALGSIWLAQLSAPLVAQACSCRIEGPEAIANIAPDPRYVVFIGRITFMDPPWVRNEHDHGRMRIERVFKGTLPAVVHVRGGGGGDCTRELAAGEHVITVADWLDGILTPGLGSPSADPDTPEGHALIAAAVAAFGPGFDPGGPPGEIGEPAAPSLLDLAGVAAGAAGVLILGVIGAVVIAARRAGREEA